MYGAAFDADAAGAYLTDQAIIGRGTPDLDAAVSFAAYHTLSDVFADQAYLFRNATADLGCDIANASPDLSTSAGVGVAAARAVLAARADDGSNAENDFADTSGYVPASNDTSNPAPVDLNLRVLLHVPNGTVRDAFGTPIATDNPATYDVQKPLSPHWGSVTPFGIEDRDDYLPPAPPKLGDFSRYVDATGKVTTGDAAFREQFAALFDITANLTDAQKATAEYWADGPQSSTPPGHWNEIARDIAIRQGHDIGEDAQFFFALNNALFDAGIAVRDAKYTYDFVRPQTAIRNLFEGQDIESSQGPDRGTGTIDGGDWIPYQDVTFVTPPFPEFTSGHSGFSYAAATIIEAFTGSDVLYDAVSRGAYDLDGDGLAVLIGFHQTDTLGFEGYTGDPIAMTWNTLWDAAADAGYSRLLGGIHIQDGDLFGRQIGAEVGRDVWASTSALFDRDASTDICVAEQQFDPGILGEGSDGILGDLRALDRLGVEGFGADDTILLEGLSLPSGGLAIKRGSAIVEVDTDLDGTPDAVITLQGDFDGACFRTISEGGVTSLTIADDADVLLGEDDEKFATQDAANNVVVAGGGDDMVSTGAGSDILDGDAGADMLHGGSGDDVLIGGTGGDIMTGGAGRDLFRFSGDNFTPSDRISADYITDFTAGTDTIALTHFANVASFEDLTFTSLSTGLGLNLGDNRFVVLEGIEDADALSASDFSFGVSAPELAITLARDTGRDDSDTLTSDVSLTGTVTNPGAVRTLELQVTADGPFFDIRSALDAAGTLTLSNADLLAAVGGTLAEGAAQYTLRATDARGQITQQTVAVIRDTQARSLTDAPSGTLSPSPEALTLTFDEAVDPTTLRPANFVLTQPSGGEITVTTINLLDANTVRVNLSNRLDNGAFELTFDGVADLAGNAIAAQQSVAFDVDSATGILSTSASDGGEGAKGRTWIKRSS